MNKRVAVVTGGIGGLGTEISRSLALAGRTVIAADLGTRADRIAEFEHEVAGLDIRFEALDAGDFDACAALVRKMKTADGAFVWQPGMVAGQPATLLGYPVVEAEDMPDVAAGSLSIAFGNFKAGYIITERAETSILRDPYSKKPYVYFYATKRVGGQVVNSKAIKLLRFA